MKPSTLQEFFDIVDKGVRRGVAKALLEHKRAGRSNLVSRGGKVVEVPPEEIQVSEEVIKEFGLEALAQAAHCSNR